MLKKKNFYKNCATLFVSLSLATVLSACGGGGSGGENSATSTNTPTPTPEAATATPTPPPAQVQANVAPLRVTPGPVGSYMNGLFGDVTFCDAQNQCVEVKDMLFDTGSSGIRVLQSALPNNGFLPTTKMGGRNVASCALYASGYAWGEVTSATVRIGNMTTTVPIPVHVVGRSSNTVPEDCSAGSQPLNTQAQLRANGIIGIGVFSKDCGMLCDLAPTVAYWTCDTFDCWASKMPIANQITNPISAMPAPFNNGTVISLPAIPSAGAKDVIGKLYVGIVDNNIATLQAPETVVNADTRGYVSMTMGGEVYTESFFDSGTNGNGFTDKTGMSKCSASAFSFFCPTVAKTDVVTMNNQKPGAAGQITSLTINTGNANQLIVSGNNAYNNMSFDFSSWNKSVNLGLPSFYGRNIFTGIENTSSDYGNGRYFAF